MDQACELIDLIMAHPVNEVSLMMAVKNNKYLFAKHLLENKVKVTDRIFAAAKSIDMVQLLSKWKGNMRGMRMEQVSALIDLF